jgi:hypothetical protein
MKKVTGTWEDNKREGMDEVDIRHHFSSRLHHRIQMLESTLDEIDRLQERIKLRIVFARHDIAELEDTVRNIHN